MTRQRWTEVKTLLDRALDLPPEERRAFAEAHCGGDEELQRELESYLDLGSDVEDLFEEPILDLIAGRPPEYRAGQQIGPYRLEGEIARGGMGVVYGARRVVGGFDQEVAIKVLRKGFDTGDFVRRFRTEQQILSDLDHPNIVQLLDGGATEDGLPYLVMESVAGSRLDLYCSQKQPDLDQRLELFLKICDAVHTAHQYMVVHCDLKPSNILVTPDGQPKLLDFGIAKILQQGQEGGDHSLTLRLGTPRYASPEQIDGAPITTTNDVYSLGALFFLLLTGRGPDTLKAPNAPLQVPSKALVEDHSHPLRPEDLRGDLDAITLKAMAWDPQERYSSAAALAEDLRRYREKLPVEARPYSNAYIVARFLGRNKRELLAGISLLLLLATGTGALLLEVKARHQASRAENFSEALFETLEAFDPTASESRAEAAKTAVDKLLASLRFEDPADRAKILDRFGRTLYRFEYLPAATDILEQALDIRRELSDPGPLAASLTNLALAVKAQRDLARASELYQEASALHEAHPEFDKYEASDLRANLAPFYEQKGETKKAETLYRETLEVRRQLYGDASPEVGRSLNNYGLFLMRKGRLDEAEPLLREALQNRQDNLGPDHPSVAKVLINLATLEDARGHHDAAVAKYRQALQIRLNGFDIKTAWAKSALAYALSGRKGPGDLTEARSLLEEALEVAVRKKEPGDHKTQIVQRNLAAVLLELGDAQAAERLIRPVVDRSQDRSPWRAADARSLLGACLLAQGDLDAARPLLEGAAEIIAKARGENSRPAREARERWEEWVRMINLKH